MMSKQYLLSLGPERDRLGNKDGSSIPRKGLIFREHVACECWHL